MIATRPAEPAGRALLIVEGMSPGFGQLPARRTRKPRVPPFSPAEVTSK